VNSPALNNLDDGILKWSAKKLGAPTVPCAQETAEAAGSSPVVPAILHFLTLSKIGSKGFS